MLTLLHTFDSSAAFSLALIGYTSRYIGAVEALTVYTSINSAVFNYTHNTYIYDYQ